MGCHDQDVKDECNSDPSCVMLLERAHAGLVPMEACMDHSGCGSVLQCMQSNPEDPQCSVEAGECLADETCAPLLHARLQGEPSAEACLANGNCAPLLQCLADLLLPKGTDEELCQTETDACMADDACAAILQAVPEEADGLSTLLERDRDLVGLG